MTELGYGELFFTDDWIGNSNSNWLQGLYAGQWSIAKKATIGLTNQLVTRFVLRSRPHSNLSGRTPVEAWDGVDPYQQPARDAWLFTAWDGLLTGVVLRR
jgi:hypothetical protein